MSSGASEPRSLIPVSVAARRLGVHPKTYDRWLDEGREVPIPVMVEGERRIIVAELEAYIDTRKRARKATGKGGGGSSKSLNRSHLPPSSES